jgi:hypothetical protein
MRTLAALHLAILSVAMAEPDVRKATWGMSQAEVLATESAKPSEVRADQVQYDSVKLGELSCELTYLFSEGKLTGAKFIFRPTHANLNDFIADYRAVDQMVEKQHGAPRLDQAYWLDDTYQDEPKSYLIQDRATASSILPSDKNVGLSVSAGHLKLFTTWVPNQRTRISHVLAGGGGRIDHQLMYTPIH